MTAGVLAEGLIGNNWKCPLCGYGFEKWLPHLLVPLDGGPLQRCHLECVHGPTAKVGTRVDSKFLSELNSLVEDCPSVAGRTPTLRLCGCEAYLSELGAKKQRPCWPPPLGLTPPSFLYGFRGLTEVRFSCCPQLRRVPPELGGLISVRTLVFISTGLEELPEELGRLTNLQELYLNGNFLRRLPEGAGRLPILREICLDANLIEELPPIVSPELVLFTAPANRLKSIHLASTKLDRVELHGNRLEQLQCGPHPSIANADRCWQSLIVLKVMGNKLTELPPEFSLMKGLRVLAIASNQIRVLPECVAKIPKLEWLFAYQNEFSEIPPGLLGASTWLERALFEGNPLTAESLIELIASARDCKVKTVGLDTAQVQRWSEAVSAASDGAPVPPLPPCVSAGSMMDVASNGQYLAKLIRSSHMRRVAGVRAPGELGGPAPPAEAADRPPLLIVAFSASQGEPEWMGLLRRLAAIGRVKALPAPEGPLSELFDGHTTQDFEECMSKLWAGCRWGDLSDTQTQTTYTDPEDDPTLEIELGDFDVLSLVDHRMRWYAEPEVEEKLREDLSRITQHYSKTLFLGASMGGAGAILHGGHLADLVVAFSPQADLLTANLRPPGESSEALRLHSERIFASVGQAAARGARVEVHCAADDHLLHALSMPLSDQCLTVHPIVPRKPFARLLDRAEVLMPIIRGAVHRLLSAPAPAAGGLAESSTTVTQAYVAKWAPKRGIKRRVATPEELLNLLAGPAAKCLPRPGDWFCAQCTRRNMSSNFFCYVCGVDEVNARISNPNSARIPGGQNYPRRGDWGCGDCLQANCGWQKWCSKCDNFMESHPKTVIVP